VALLFVLALLFDSTCAAACIPIELKLAAKDAADCSESHHDRDRESCDLHGHLKPVVKETAMTVADVPAFLGTSAEKSELRAAGTWTASIDRPHPLPLLQRTSILRI
jgi:hypothetical protein